MSILTSYRTSAIFAISALSTAFAGAQTVWYNGDHDHLAGIYSMVGLPNETGSERTVFEDFVWNSADTAKSVMGTTIADSAYTQLRWEIRTGITASSAGTLLFSGTATPILTFRSVWSVSSAYNEYWMTANIGSVALTHGESYWLGLAAVSTGADFGGGFGSTSGQNGIGSPISNGVHWEIWGDGHIDRGADRDISIGISASAVPEPLSLLALATCCGLFLRRRSSRP